MQDNKIKIYIRFFFLPKIVCQISLYGYVLPTFFVAIVFFPNFYGEVALILKILYEISLYAYVLRKCLYATHVIF